MWFFLNNTFKNVKPWQQCYDIAEDILELVEDFVQNNINREMVRVLCRKCGRSGSGGEEKKVERKK